MKKIIENKGFTLVELIVVIGILAVLASIAIPNLIGMVEKSKQAKDEANAKLIADATIMWMAEDQFSNSFNEYNSHNLEWPLGKYLNKSFADEIPRPISKKYKGNNGEYYINHDGNGKITVVVIVDGERVTVYPKPVD